MSVARSYARALYDSAQEAEDKSVLLDVVEADLQKFELTLTEFKALNVALLGPLTSAKEKANLAVTVSKALGCGELVSRFLALLARKGRFALLKKIQQAFAVIRLEAENGVWGQLISADVVEQSELDRLVKVFSQKLGKKVAFRTSIDSSVLAGIRVTVNGVTYDGTLQSQIQKLSEHFIVGATHTVK